MNIKKTCNNHNFNITEFNDMGQQYAIFEYVGKMTLRELNGIILDAETNIKLIEEIKKTAEEFTIDSYVLGLLQYKQDEGREDIPNARALVEEGERIRKDFDELIKDLEELK